MFCRARHFAFSLICFIVFFSGDFAHAKRLSKHLDPRLEIFEENVEEVPSEDCSIFSRSIRSESLDRVSKSTQTPLVIAINGIPASSWIYRDFALKLYKQGWNLRLIDLPGTARSKMQKKTVWVNQRSCLETYLHNIREPFVLVLHDIAVPIVLPLIPRLYELEGLLVFNGILKTKGFRPVPPMSTIKTHILGDIGVFLMNSAKFRKDFLRLGVSKETDTLWIDQIYSDVKAEGSKRHLPIILRGFENSEEADTLIRNAVTSFRGPKIAIWGMADPSLGSQGPLAAEIFGQDNFYALTQAKHFPMLDHASEITKAFNEVFGGLKIYSKVTEPRSSRARSTQ